MVSLTQFGLLCVWLLEVLWWFVKKCIRAVFRFEARGKRNFSCDIVLITGAAQGLGKELAIQFSKCGATLVLWDINETKLHQTCSEITSQGKEAFAYVVDCSDREQVYQTAEKVREEIGKVNILVNNAAVLIPRTFLDLKDAQINAMVNVNILGYIWVST